MSYSHIYLLGSKNARKREHISIGGTTTINSKIRKKKVAIKQVLRRRTRKSYSNGDITSSTKFLIGAFDRLKLVSSCPSMQKSSFLWISFQSRFGDFTKAIGCH